jgi:type I restriction enzyme S subunit
MVSEWPIAIFESQFAEPLRNGLTRPKAVRGTGIKMVNMGELFAHSRIGDIPMDRVQVSSSEAQRFLLSKGDLLFARQSLVLSGAGKCSIFTGLGEPVTYEGHLIRARIDTKVASPDFYYYFFNSPIGRQAIQGIAEQVAAAGIRGSDLAKLRVPLPPLPEQHAIARVLGALDDKIELNRRMNETLEALARALFQSWFVDFDPVRAKREGRQPAGMDAETAALFPGSFEASELGEIPAGWRLGKLGEVMNSPRRGVDPTSVDGDTPYIGLEHMPRGSIALSEWGKADDVTSTKMGFQQGEILFGKLRPYFHKVGVAPVDGVASSDIIVITSEPDWLGFVLGYVSSTAFVEYTNGASTGTQMPRASWSDMSKYPIALPPQSVAKIYSQIINPMVQHIHANIIQSSSLAAIRDALLPKLLSGEVRAATVEEGMETAA